MMSRKALSITVELDIHAVTCPGVWLCPNGKVSLKICSMSSTGATVKLPAMFPLLYHEKFIFKKIFSNICFLVDLQNHLATEYIYAELIQWPESGVSIVLATFETSLLDLLFPKSFKKAKITGIDVDLLMEPSQSFPGILAPKIEVSTKTTIDEIVKSSRAIHNGDTTIVSPKVLSSKHAGIRSSKHRTSVRRQRKVCHSRSYRRKYHKLSRCVCHSHHKHNLQTPFVVRHVDDSSGSSKLPRVCAKSKSNKCKSKALIRASPCQPLTWQSGSGRVYSPRTNCQMLNDKQQVGEPDVPEQSNLTGNKRNRCACGSRLHLSGCCILCNQYKDYFGKDCSKYGPKLPYDTESKRCKKNVTECPRITCPSECCTVKACVAPDKLAGDIKQRVDDVLDVSRHYPFLEEKEIHSAYNHPYTQDPNMLNHEGEHSKWNCYRKPNNNKPSYREEFYQNLEKFYRKLYKRAKARSILETDVC